MRRLPPRARALTVVVIVTNVAGNALLSAGMKGAGSMLDAVLHPFVLLGVVLLTLWTLSRTALMSWADLSYVLPVTASGYILTAVVGAAFLGESVTLQRWGATLLIVAGIALAGTTQPKTTERPR
ncbi:MAG TPA: hypothetical protein VES20_22540 [Bryobacteraceae bacterium]|nr:hypothetical protein [Bryobacteraceae bacterium]